MGKTAMLLLVEGAEEMEAVITIDVLRRAGVAVTVAGVDGDATVKCSRGVFIKPDLSLKDALKSAPYDAVIMPGGLGGAENLAKSEQVGAVLKEQAAGGRLVAAICAAPIALAAHGIYTGRAATSYPNDDIKAKLSGYSYREDRVVVDGPLVTSRGPGTAFEFGLALVRELLGPEAAQKTGDPLLLLSA